MIFCDTSALAKMYVPEKESTSVIRLLEAEDQVFLSELARVELMGVFHRQLRERLWSRDQFDAAARQFMNDELAGFWTWLPLDSPIIDAGMRAYFTLPQEVFLRSADCIHLVTALRHGLSEVLTFDRNQIAGAAALGMKVRGVLED